MAKYNLIDYALAKEALEELPKLQFELDKTYKKVYDYKEFLGAQYVLDAIIESKHLIKRQLKEAKEIVDRKGKE